MLEIKHISKNYGGFSLEDISFTVPENSYTVMLGPSGAGKTQVLEIIAGLIRPDSGSIFLDGGELTHTDARFRPVGIVFQDLAIFPHLNVERNIAYALKTTGMSPAEKEKVVKKEAEKLGIAHLMHRRPTTLSGGELQRVALARTLVRKPRYLLLDEPLSSLDVKLRHDLISLLRTLHREGQSILHVTHDYEETLLLASHISVINNGKIVQSGTTEQVFHHPGSEFVARFTGIKNYFEARLHSAQGIQYARLSNGREIRLVSGEADGIGFVLIPGEEIILSCDSFESSASNQWKGTVKEVFAAPGSVEVLVDAGLPLYVKITRESKEKLCLEVGGEVWLSFKAAGVRFIRA